VGEGDSFVWVLLVTTPDGHDSPDDVTLHASAQEAIDAANLDNEEYRIAEEDEKPIAWEDDPLGHHCSGEGYLYNYDVQRHALPHLAAREVGR
jgi:hypothetical protein